MRRVIFAFAAAIIVASAGAALADDSGFPNWLQRQQDRDYRAWAASRPHLVDSAGQAKPNGNRWRPDRPSY